MGRWKGHWHTHTAISTPRFPVTLWTLTPAYTTTTTLPTSPTSRLKLTVVREYSGLEDGRS